jgi:hypothetical protein
MHSPSKVEFRRGPKISWEEIELPSPLLGKSDGEFEMAWNPGEASYDVRAETELHYRVTLRDNARLAYVYEIPKSFRPWSLWAIIHRTWKSTVNTYNALPAWARVVFWPAGGYLGLAVVMITLWLFRRPVLAGWAMQDLAALEPPDWKEWKWWVKIICLVRWLGGTQRALDAWIRANYSQLHEKCYTECEAVRKRLTYVDLGNQRDIEHWQSLLSKGGEGAYWITGAGGGSGKSTLAFHLAALRPASAKAHPFLPLVVEHNWLKDKLLDLMADRLRVGSRKPTPDMVRKLGHTGRLLPIMDGLSERQVREAGNPPVTPTQQVIDLLQKGYFRHLLITSRDRPPAGSTVREVTVAPLDKRRRREFVRKYAPDHTTWKEILRQLRDWSEPQQLRPLFARMAIERLCTHGQLPSTYPALVADYVCGIRPQGEGSLREDDFLRACRVLAFACVYENTAPDEVFENVLEAHLNQDATQCPFLTANPGATSCEPRLSSTSSFSAA